jgi:hypothetical protein
MYFPTLSSMFKKNEYRRKVINQLEGLKDDIDALVKWDEHFKYEWIVIHDEESEDYNKDYLELQRIVNKILKVKED